MGLEPGTTKDDVRRCLENWNKGDNGILYLSRAYRLQPGTGWQIDPGILHAPGSLVTYEPQVNSDVFAMFQSEVEGRIIAWEPARSRTCRPSTTTISTTSSACSTGTRTSIPSSAQSNRVFPKPVRPFAETEPEGYREQWVMLRHAAGTRRRS